MEICYHLLGLGKRATQRELYYKLLSSSSSYISGQEQLNRSIQGKTLASQFYDFSFGYSDHQFFSNNRSNILQIPWQYCSVLVGAWAFLLRVKAP